MKIFYVRGKPEREIMEKVRNGEIIIIKGEKIISMKIIESAYLKAKRAFQYGKNISRDLGTETMLYLSSNRQVSQALEEFGAEGYGNYFIISENDFIPEAFGMEEINFSENKNLDDILKEMEKIALFEIKK